MDKAKSSIHPSKNIFVQYRANDGLEYLDLSNITSASVFVKPTISGAAPASTDGAMLDWDPSINKFVAWDRSGTAMYFLTLPTDHVNGTWVWTSAAGTGGVTPALPQFQGTHGRFRAVPSLGGVLLMSTGVDPICFYKY